MARGSGHVSALPEAYGPLVAAVRFTCTRCGVNGVKRERASTACTCGAELVMWESGQVSPLHGWHGPTPRAHVHQGRPAKRPKPVRRKPTLRQLRARATVDLFAAPAGPDED